MYSMSDPMPIVACLSGQYYDIKATDKIDPTTSDIEQTSDISFNGGICQNCPTGWAQPSEFSFQCLQCSPGKIADKTGSTDCTECKAKMYQDSYGEMKWYVFFFYLLSLMLVFIRGLKVFTFLFLSNSKQCLIGQFSNKGASFCTECTVGRFGSKPGFCSDCQIGKYNDAKGASFCKRCPVDSFNNLTASLKIEECLNCHLSYKPHTTTGTKDGVSNPTLDCLCKSEQLHSDDPAEKRGYYQTPDQITNCSPCPIGANCKKHGLTLKELQSKQQFWRDSNTSVEFVDCATAYIGEHGRVLAKQRCVENLINASNVGAAWSPDQQCRKFYTKVALIIFTIFALCLLVSVFQTLQPVKNYRGPLCASCFEADFVKNGDTCLKCQGGANFMASIFATATTGFVLGILHYILLKCIGRLKKLQKRAPPGNANRWISQMKTLIMFGQILQSIPASFDHIDWPINYIDFSLNLKVFNLDFFPLFNAASCRLVQPPLEAFIVHMVSIPVFATFIWFAYTLFTCSSKSKRMKKVDQARQKEMTVKVLIFIFQLAYPGMSAHIFRVFRCRKIPGMPHLRYTTNLDIICFQGKHKVLVVMASTCIIFVVVGFPLAVFLVLLKNRKHLYNKKSPKHHEIAYEFGPLYMTYEEDYWYFEVIKILVSVSSIDNF